MHPALAYALTTLFSPGAAGAGFWPLSWSARAFARLLASSCALLFASRSACAFASTFFFASRLAPRRSRMRHELGYHQGMESIQPSNGRFYSLQPPPPGPATPGGSLAARGRPQCRSGSRAPAHPCAGAAGARRKLLPTSDGWQGASGARWPLPARRPAGGQTGGFWGLRSQKTAVLPCDSLKVAGRTDAGL